MEFGKGDVISSSLLILFARAHNMACHLCARDINETILSGILSRMRHELSVMVMKVNSAQVVYFFSVR